MVVIQNKKENMLVASYVTLPDMEKPYPDLLTFLSEKFPHIDREIWQNRLDTGKISDDSDNRITRETPYTPNMRLTYFREVAEEPKIPFPEKILYHDNRLVVADKPHFLPVTPSGPYVKETLLYRLIEKTGEKELTPIHRIDRETAGIVVFSTRKKLRGAYQQLFDRQMVKKKYEAIGKKPEELDRTEWLVKSRIERSTPFFLMKNTSGIPNSQSHIRCLRSNRDNAYFQIEPSTGKKHQIRLHLCQIGSGIVNDRYYPVLMPEAPPDFSAPLKLLAKELCFHDPISGKEHTFRSARSLD